MSPVIRRRRRVAAALVGLLALAIVAVLTSRGSAVHADEAAGPVGIEAQIGSGNGAILLGPAAQTGTASETWAISSLNDTIPQPKTVDGQQLPVTKQYVLRYRPAEGWRYVQAPLDEQGQPYAGTIADGRVTARGGLLLAGTDTTRPEGAQRAILVRDAEGPTRVVAAPGPGVLKPRQGSEPAETLSASALAARAAGDGRTEGFVAVTGPALSTAVARWDGDSWSREPICVAEDGSTPPPGCAAGDTLDDSQFGLTPVALATTEGGDAWLLARAHDDAHRGLVLFHRDGNGSSTRWRLRDLGAPRFASDATPADGVTAVAALAGGHAATATTDGVWLDGSFQQNGSDRSVTLKVGNSGPTRSWCDGGLCDASLGFALRTDGRSQAWAGNGPGTRVIGPIGATQARYASFDGNGWTVSAAFGTAQNGVAFSSLGEGWLGDVHLTRDRSPSPLAAWSIPVRRPLTAIAAESGAAGDTATPALAVGIEGNVLRYSPGQGWDSEVRLTASGVSRDNLRSVAWPEPSTAFAVGDEGAMWRWRKATGLWESDPAAPFDFTGHLTGIAFQPGNPDRGFAVGRDGVLLQYGKSWQQMTLPAELASAGPGGGKADLYAVAFAGSQALAAAGKSGVLVEKGSGWSVDEGAKALLDRTGNGGGGSIVAVAGLPDGGAVAAGTSGDRAAVVLERDGPDGPWRFSAQPLPAGVIAASAFREDGRVRALVSVSPTVWPTVADLQVPQADPSSPAPRRSPFGLPVDGYLMRETALGWRDEERTKLDGPTTEKPRKSDPVLALLGDGAGRAWTVGGWSGAADLLGRGNTDPGPLAPAQTAAVSRYDPAGPQGSSNVTVQTPTMDAGRARLLVGGHAQCADACADLAPIDTMPDRTLSRAVGLANQLGTAPTGPRAFVYTGGRIAASGNLPASNAEALRYASLLMGGSLPTFPAVAAGEATGGSSSAFESAFAGYAAPLGAGVAAGGTVPVAIGAAPAPGRACTHYAVDVATAEGVVRLVVIDNASGSLALRNDVGNPAEDQGAWLAAVLADAKAKRIATIVSGSRSLDPRDPGAASDGTAVAVLLRDGGASAYVYDGRGEQRRGTIPAGSTVTIPSYASGTLGYRAENDGEGRGVPGLLLLELDLAHRDATTNRAPAGVRLVPVLDDLALEAVDGRVLNRSTPALFEGLGRRPRAGGNWVIGAGNTSEGNGADPYVTFPSPICATVRRESCAQTRIDPDVRFHSSDPDIADFVRVDPTSTNPRKPYVDPATDKPVPDASSGLVCPFNAGTTTISIEAGGLRYQTTITVRAGSVLRPCGTVPLNPSRFPAANGSASPPPPPPPPPPGASPSSTPAVAPPPPLPAAAPVNAPPPPVTPAAVVPPVAKPLAAIPAALPAFIAPILNPPLAVPPPPAAASPAPPPGTSGASINVPVSQPVTQAERQKDEEVAEESSKAYARYDALAAPNQGSSPGDGAAIVAAVLLAALGGGTALGARRRQRTPYVYARETARAPEHERRNRRPR